MNISLLRYGAFEIGREMDLSKMIWDVFCEFEAPDYSEEGIQTFKEFINPEKLSNEILSGKFKVRCCYDEEDIVGVLAFWEISHISLLFVKSSYHKMGIAKTMIKHSIEEIRMDEPNICSITVNSSPYAVQIYEKLGFEPVAGMQETHGILYRPMVKWLKNQECL